MKLNYLSASRITTFEQCQLKYHAIYDLGMKDKPHPLTLMGSAVHKMFEVATKARLRGKHETLHDPLRLLDSSFSKYHVDPEYKDLATELVNNAVEWGYFRKLARTDWCEVSFYEELPDGTKVKGFIDRLDLMGNEADIIDLKTQKREFTDEQLDKSWQARIYNWAARKIRPQITGTVTVSFWVLRHKVQRVWLTAEDAAETEQKLMEMADIIRNCTAPTGTVTPLCNWCPYQNECPEKNMSVKARFNRSQGK